MEDLKRLQLPVRRLPQKNAAKYSYFKLLLQAKFNRLILNVVIPGLHPLNIVEQTEYQELFWKILPSTHLMSRKTFVNMVVDQFTSIKGNVCLSKQLLQLQQTHSKSFLRVTVYWIDPETLLIYSFGISLPKAQGAAYIQCPGRRFTGTSNTN